MKPLFFGIACSCTSTDTKVIEQNVKSCVFMFLQYCKKKFAQVFIGKLSMRVWKRLNVTIDFASNDKRLILSVFSS